MSATIGLTTLISLLLAGKAPQEDYAISTKVVRLCFVRKAHLPCYNKKYIGTTFCLWSEPDTAVSPCGKCNSGTCVHAAISFEDGTLIKVDVSSIVHCSYWLIVFPKENFGSHSSKRYTYLPIQVVSLLFAVGAHTQCVWLHSLAFLHVHKLLHRMLLSPECVGYTPIGKPDRLFMSSSGGIESTSGKSGQGSRTNASTSKQPLWGVEYDFKSSIKPSALKDMRLNPRRWCLLARPEKQAFTASMNYNALHQQKHKYIFM